jgi:DNA/RNA endonuclease YhcR with UshA esterase domain
MKTFVVSLVTLGLSAGCVLAEQTNQSAPKVIGAIEAKDNVDSTVVVTGKVAQVSVREKMVYLNLEEPYPDSPLSAVIFARSTNQFPEVEKLKGRNVEISGKIEEFRERPQIVINSTNQLKVVEEKKTTEKSEADGK